MKDRVLYVLAGFVACLLLAMAYGRMMPLQKEAHAQSPGTGAGEITVALGPIHRNALPIVIVDSTDNSLLIYEADVSRTRWNLELKNARSLRYDKRIREFNTEPEISQVRELLDRRQQ